MIGDRVFKTLSTIARELGISRIDLLKMDIEGYEWVVLPAIMKDFKPRQILVEFHTDDGVNNVPQLANLDPVTKNWAFPFINMMRTIDKAGYQVAMKETNVKCGHCCEFVLVHV